MVAAWMLYAAAVAALLAAGAAALDRALRAGGRPTRLVWGAAIAASLLLPAAARWRARTPVPFPAHQEIARADDTERERALAVLRLLAAARAQAADAVSPRATWDALDRPLLALWGAASLALLGWLALSHRALRRRRRAWREAAVDGERVLVAPDVGPAVVGVAGARVVLPAWALAVEPRERALMLEHEREHVRAGDPLLLAAAAAAAALAPWSPAVWWQLRRLRLAVEVDCDRRVLRRHPDVRAYGGLLLDVARRAHPTPRLAAAALASPVTSLERRIRIMTSPRTRRTAAQAAALSAAAVALTVVACETPRPTAPRPEARPALTAITAASPDVAPSSHPTDATVRAAIERHYPDVLRSRTGRQQQLWFLADSGGNVVQAAWERSGETTAPGLGKVDPNAIASVDVMKMPPGRIAPDSVAVVWVALRVPGSKAGVTARGEGTVMTGARVTRLDGNTIAVAGATLRPAEQPPVRLEVRSTTAAGAPKPAPLYLIDGREVPAEEVTVTLARIDRDDIASVEVLKNAAAVTAYGEKGANGVVKITTKRAPTQREY